MVGCIGSAVYVEMVVVVCIYMFTCNCIPFYRLLYIYNIGRFIIMVSACIIILHIYYVCYLCKVPWIQCMHYLELYISILHICLACERRKLRPLLY